MNSNSLTSAEFAYSQESLTTGSSHIRIFFNHVKCHQLDEPLAIHVTAPYLRAERRLDHGRLRACSRTRALQPAPALPEVPGLQRPGKTQGLAGIDLGPAASASPAPVCPLAAAASARSPRRLTIASELVSNLQRKALLFEQRLAWQPSSAAPQGAAARAESGNQRRRPSVELGVDNAL